MKRRAFLSCLSAFGLAPAVPLAGTSASVAATVKGATYNRVTFGYAVFWARHGGQFGAAQLAKALRVSLPQAQAMVDEMLRDRLARVTAHVVHATTTHGGATRFARTSERRKPLYWHFKRVGRRARALQWQIFNSNTSSAPALP